MSDNRKNVIKFNRDIRINVATVVIAGILLYVVIFVIMASKKEPITTYKVNKTSVSNNISLNGLIVRDEKILNSTAAGYICYYIRDGEKVRKNSTVCTIDETGQVYNTVKESALYDDLLTEDDYNEIRSLISLYKVGYDDNKFYTAYSFYNNANNKVLELTNEILMQQTGGASAVSGLSAISSPDSGVITYYTDGFEDYKLEDISKDAFNRSSYKKQTLKSGDIVSAGTPIVKIVPSEKWNIVAEITPEQISAISESEYITIRINNSDKEIRMPYEIINTTDGSYINIKLDKYMKTYLSERYVTVEIIKDEDTGLKVPVSAIVDKDVYKIDKKLFTGGGNQNYDVKLNMQYFDEEKSQYSVKQISPNIIKFDEDVYFVDPASFEASDVILNIDTNETVAVSVLPRDSLKGVYMCNRGIAEFTMIDIIKVIDEFALIQSDGGIKVYDNIVLDSGSVVENQIIY